MLLQSGFQRVGGTGSQPQWVAKTSGPTPTGHVFFLIKVALNSPRSKLRNQDTTSRTPILIIRVLTNPSPNKKSSNSGTIYGVFPLSCWLEFGRSSQRPCPHTSTPLNWNSTLIICPLKLLVCSRNTYSKKRSN